jgi:hypothetical protein
VNFEDMGEPVGAFKKGSEVEWTSQAAGIRKTKRGVVLAVLPPMAEPNLVLKELGIRGRIVNPGWPRGDTSYLVRAGGRLYWPRASLLKTAAHEVDRG